MNVGDLVKLNPNVFKMGSDIGVVTKVIQAGSVEVTWANNLVTHPMQTWKLRKVNE